MAVQTSKSSRTQARCWYHCLAVNGPYSFCIQTSHVNNDHDLGADIRIILAKKHRGDMLRTMAIILLINE
ncbi:hypothetical protein BPAE_0093g00160 [Botrytis paeoniae]|uniref:Uncharacterized protein n=1 Tax=Botrytis paeoniae TaxID=278948 RepID=A0A4Z1FK71_9HELO|nr:hypothetical protein BPAE_0093g00160 [Botrytis paeoniae]